MFHNTYRLCILAFFILFSNLAKSQETRSKIGIVLSNNYSRLENLHLLSGERLRPSHQIGFGFNGNFALNNKWSLEFGWMYSFRGNETSKKKIDYSNFPSIDPSFPTHTNFSEKYEFIDLPLKLFRNFRVDKKLNHFVSAGIVPTFNIQYKVTKTTYSDDKDVYAYFYPENKLNRINALFLIGYGVSFKVYKNISSQIELNVKRSALNVFTEESKLNNHFWEAGISTSIYWR